MTTLWKVWEKTYAGIFALFVILNVWAARAFGGLAIGRAWALVFMLIGAASLLYARRTMDRARASTRWFPVEARIVKSEVAVEHGRNTVESDPLRSRTEFYTPNVSYEYEFQGRIYRSGRIVLANVNYPRAQAEAAVARYPAGSRAVAHVDPGDPKTAVLETGVEGKTDQYVVPFIAGGAFMLFGLAAWIAMPFILRN